MTKSELIYELANKKELPAKTAEEIINLMFNGMIDALRSDDRIEIRRFGSFTIRGYNARIGLNPKTGEPVSVKPRKSPFFKVGKELKERLAKNHIHNVE